MMFDWLEKLLPWPQKPEPPVPPTSEEALTALRHMISDAVVEDVWEGLDLHVDTLKPRVRDIVERGQLGRYPMHAAVLWLAYQEGNNDRLIDDALAARLRDSVLWALGFEENQVLIGGALGALDGLEERDREELALEVFEELGPTSARRYWLLMKVKTDAFVAEVARSLEDYDPELRPKMAGAFRQMAEQDVDVLLEHHDLASPGAAMLVEALAATRSEAARPALRAAFEDPRPDVRDAARRGLERDS